MLYFHKCFRMLTLTVAIIMLCCMYGCRSLLTVTSESKEEYLQGDTPFHAAAKMVMPGKEMIDNSTEYYYVRTNYFEGMRLVLTLPPNQYFEFARTIKAGFENMQTELSGRPYYFKEDPKGMFGNGNKFYCYTFALEGEDYAVAYAVNDEAGTVEYIFFNAYELCTMTVKDALCTADEGHITSFYRELR